MKQFLFIVGILLMPAFSNIVASPKGELPILLQVGYLDPTKPGDPHPKSPVAMPEFYLDGYTLTAGSYTVGSTVVLKDEDGEVVFTSYIYVEGDTITLPSTLSGTYTIEVTRGSLTFVGEIEL